MIPASPLRWAAVFQSSAICWGCCGTARNTSASWREYLVGVRVNSRETNRSSERYAYPIFSLDMVVGKAYVVTSPALLHAVQRNKALNFDLALALSGQRIGGVSGPGLQLLRDKQSGGQGLNQTIIHAMLPTLTGQPLDRMNQRMIQLLRPLVDDLATYKTVDFYSWCSHAITMASTEAFYGPLNPYKRREIEDAFW